MKKTFMAKFKLLFTVILALTMAFSLLSSVACKSKGGDDSSSSSSSTTTITERTDTKTLKNGDFEFGTANTAITSFPVSSSINWSRSNNSSNGTSAPTSSYSSGVIDTREFKYEYDEDGFVALDEDGKPVHLLNEDGEKIELFNAIAKNKNDQFIKIYEKEEDGSNKKDENGNDIYTYYNPRTPSYYGLTDYSDQDGLTGGGKILMINNRNSSEEGLGTAQYFSYSGGGLTLLPGETGKIELWLMTKDLVSAMDEDFTDYGAWIEIDTTLGSINTPATRIKNIDTDGQWTKFTFFVEGSNYAQTTINVKVGLGLGNKNIKQEYVEGYVFVDDVYFNKVDKEEIPTSSNFSSAVYHGEFLNKGDDGQTDSYFDKNFKTEYLSVSTIIANPTTGSEYAFLAEDYAVNTNYTDVITVIDCKKEEQPFVTTPEFLDQNSIVEELNNYTGSTGVNDAGSYQTTWTTFDALGLNNPFDKTDIFEIKYTKEANISYETNIFSLGDENLMISFWVKTKLNPAVSGLNVYLVDKGDLNCEPVEVAIKENFITVEGENEENDDWTKFTVIVSNNYKAQEGDTVKTRFFSIKLVLGPTKVTDSIFAFSKGSAYLANLSAMFLIKNDELNEVASVEKTNNTVIERVLQADLTNTSTKTESTDNYTFTYGGMVDSIENGVVNGINKYSGVIGNHNRVGGTKTAISQEGTIAGLFNTEFIDNYSADTFGAYKSDIKNWLSSVETNNEYLQPLMINNSVDGISYGYIGESTAITSNTTALISLKVKIFGNSTAYIYLTDADDKKDFSILGVNAEHQNLGDNIDQLVNGDYILALNAQDINTVTGDSGYATVSFLIKTGNKGINFRLEMWNGPRLFNAESADTTGRNAGIVLFDEYSFTSGVDLDIQLIKLKSKFNSNLINVTGIDYDYSFQTADANKQIFTRLPSTVLTDENPDGITRYYDLTDKNNTKTAYMSNGFFTVSDLTSIDVTNEIDERTVEDSSDNDTSTSTDDGETTSYSPFLYFTSLAVSVVLILALLAIVVKHVITSIKKKKAKNHSYYDKNLREVAFENIKAKTKETKFKEEYDYDNIESNLIEETEETEEVETETEVLEETETEQVETEIEETLEETKETEETETPKE